MEVTSGREHGQLGFRSALMIVSDYYGELVITADVNPRWVCCFASMSFLLYIVSELLVGLAAATSNEADTVIAFKSYKALLIVGLVYKCAAGNVVHCQCVAA